MFYTSAFLRKKKGKSGEYWVGVLSYKDEAGKWQQKSKSLAKYRLKRDAKKALNEWWEEEEAKSSLKNRGLTIQQAIETALQKQKNLKIISNRTYTNNIRQARKAIYPLIGDLTFADTTQADLQDFVDTLCETYAPSSVMTIFAIVSKTFTWGLNSNKILDDVSKKVILPKQGQRRINYLTKEGRKKFLAAMADEESQFYLPSMIAYYEGARAGEICAIHWYDINFAANYIVLDESAKDYRDLDSGEMVEEISDMKTYKKRIAPLMPQLKVILQRKMERENPKPDDLVCGITKPTLLCTSFQKWAKRHQILGSLGKPITMHGLRHTFATVGVQSGMDVKSLSSILGHSSAAMTLDIYAEADEQAKISAMGVLGSFMSDEEEDDL